jgi:hypothetical protein
VEEFSLSHFPIRIIVLNVSVCFDFQHLAGSLTQNMAHHGALSSCLGIATLLESVSEIAFVSRTSSPFECLSSDIVVDTEGIKLDETSQPPYMFICTMLLLNKGQDWISTQLLIGSGVDGSCNILAGNFLKRIDIRSCLNLWRRNTRSQRHSFKHRRQQVQM